MHLNEPINNKSDLNFQLICVNYVCGTILVYAVYNVSHLKVLK